jgi:hypothetical protein
LTEAKLHTAASLSELICSKETRIVFFLPYFRIDILLGSKTVSQQVGLNAVVFSLAIM